MKEFSPEVVVHLAAIHFIPDCEAHPGLALQANVVSTVNLLERCPPFCGFVLASSAAVYHPSIQPHDEITSRVGPEDVYGLSKVQAEEWVRHFAGRRSISAVIARLSNVIGPGETNPHVLPEILAQLQAGHHTLEMGNLESRRDYLDVEDAARGLAILATTTSDLERVEVVNLGSGKSHSVAEVLEILRALPGAPAFSVRVAVDRLRPVDRPVLSVQIEKAEKLFGWQPRNELADTIRRTWENPALPPSLTDRYQPTQKSE
jgi:UDP-glucose 4-epimerase